jgi:hypothetical protein
LNEFITLEIKHGSMAGQLQSCIPASETRSTVWQQKFSHQAHTKSLLRLLFNRMNASDKYVFEGWQLG